jgi:predicted dehydrogenase
MDKWWIPGTSIGYEHTFVHQVADFLKSLETGEKCSPTFAEALETQKVCEAVLSSAKTRSWQETRVNW